ncbi:hypothetical protein DEO72_LG8g579 [Vigna unguiculata]|uniref:Uncharacterized protein n=1 Tax=Vigna unguiculata TaxID=3917 RepID=A0A4D6MP62_VIGUN|nr:hypothetical protein DEO72_LG8g579 [Vigna unguiculata]
MSIASCSCQVGWDLNLAVTALNSVEMMKLHCIIKLFGVKNRRNTPLECCLSCMVALHRTTTAFRGGGSCNVTVRDRSFECQLGDERGSCVVVHKSFGCDFLGEEVIRGGKQQKKNDVADGKIHKALGDIRNLANVRGVVEVKRSFGAQLLPNAQATTVVENNKYISRDTR